MTPARRRLVTASVVLVAAGVGVWLALGGPDDDSGRAARTATSAPSTTSTMPATTTTTTPANVRISAATSYAAGYACNGPSYEFALQGRTVTLVSIAGTPAASNPSAEVASDGVYFLAFEAPNGVASTMSGRIHPTTVSGTSKQGDCIYTFAGRA